MEGWVRGGGAEKPVTGHVMEFIVFPEGDNYRHNYVTLLYLFQASFEPAVSPFRSPLRIPSPETVTPPLSASHVERNIKDAVSTSHNNRKFL